MKKKHTIQIMVETEDFQSSEEADEEFRDIFGNLDLNMRYNIEIISEETLR